MREELVVKKVSLQTAYILWLPSFFGFAGLHRLYLGKTGTGILYLLTGGLAMIGTLYDLFAMPRLVRESRFDSLAFLDEDLGREWAVLVGGKPRDSIERVILRTAKVNKGITTPSEVALEGNYSIEEARMKLEELAGKGFAEMRIRESGTVVYAFPDFLSQSGEDPYLSH